MGVQARQTPESLVSSLPTSKKKTSRIKGHVISQMSWYFDLKIMLFSYADSISTLIANCCFW